MIYQLTTVNDYPLVDINGRIFLLDSGAPSMAFDGITFVEINGDSLNLRITPSLSHEAMIMSFGRDISGFIGIDIIAYFGVIEIDKERGEVRFGETTHEYKQGFDLYNGFHFDVLVNNQNARAYLDTGANIPMIFNEMLLDMRRFVETVDEPANNGILRLRKFKSTVAFAGKEVELPVLEANANTYGDGSDVIMGINQFAEAYYVIDLKHGRVWFE